MNKINTSKFIFIFLLITGKNMNPSSQSFLCEDIAEQLRISQRRLIDEILSCKTVESINQSLMNFYRVFPNSISELTEAAIDEKNITLIQILIKQGQKNTVLATLSRKPNVAQLCIDIMSFISEANR